MNEKEIFQMRYSGVEPEGFVLMTEQALEKLKDFETWKKWKNNEIKLIDLEFDEKKLTE